MTIPRPVLFAALAVPVVAVAVDPSLVSAAGLDLWNLPAAKRAADEQDAIGRQLAEADARVVHRITLKERAVADLLAGRITLADAADRFAALSADPDDRPAAVRAVLDHARLRAADRPDRDRVVAALEAEAAGGSAD